MKQHHSVYLDVKLALKANPQMTSAEIYERIKDNWPGVNQKWLRRNIVSYKAHIIKFNRV